LTWINPRFAGRLKMNRVRGYKTLVVHLDRDPRRAERLEVALALADRFDAHLVGLFAPGEVHLPGYVLAEAGERFIESQQRLREASAREAMESFREAAARHPGLKTEWRDATDGALAAVRMSARYSDLVVVGQRDREVDPAKVPAPGFVDELVLSCGRPVLVVPYAGRFATLGRRALVAWNASPEAARAVTDALPFLAAAESVHVVSLNPHASWSGHGESPGADIALYLARHGVKATVWREDRVSDDLGEQLLSRAADVDADLIVMGAYGHSKLRELVMGGVTRTLLDSMTAPVLMSH
jgi:nucleotide-binding universal stress UspA family protein